LVAETSGMATHAGSSSLERFRRERKAKLKEDWYLWLGIAALSTVAIALMSQLGTVGLLVGAWILGFVSALTLFGWMIGFDVRSLTWLWGSWGEEQTADELEKLGDGWHVVHDIENGYGNWDHVVVGRPGVFVVDTKRLSREVNIKNDGLESGRTRYEGRSFRGSAVGLRKRIINQVGTCPWVQAVVAIWGDFPQGLHSEGNVSYIAAEQLANWLSEQPDRLSDHRASDIAQSFRSI
jgi:hypothetical protein